MDQKRSAHQNIRKSSTEEAGKSKEGRRMWINHTHGVRKWKNLIHLGLVC
jgi:hypothetical protein